MFTWVQGTHVTRLISPEVDLTDMTSVTLSFLHFYDDYSGSGPKLGVATRSGCGDWNVVWEIDPTSKVGPEEVTMTIDNGDLGQADFQFCFYLDGNMYNIDYWYVDDIWVFEPLELDVQLKSINMPTYLAGDTPVEGTVKNIGNTQVTSFDVVWYTDGGEIYATSVSGLLLDFGDTYDFTCDQLFSNPIGEYNLNATVENVNGGTDEDPSNNTKMKEVNIVSHTNYRKVCMEEFTSSTCGPCATLNQQFVPWCNNHADEISLLKYQMNWPGSGDPYYTPEGGVRKDYYGVSGVPAVFVNGEYIGYQFGGIQPAFDNAVLQPGLLDIASTHSLDGSEMSITANVAPFSNFPGHRVYIAVFEYLTTGNVATNGETEFEHVMMKMVPDAEGTTLDMMDREPFSISETVDLSGTNVEEWDDLGVIVFIQNYGTQEIFQSAYSQEDSVYGTDAMLSDLMVNGGSISNFDPEVFEYQIEIPEGTTEIPVVEAVANDDNALAIVIPATEVYGTASVDVFAEDRLTKQTYTINFILGTGMEDSQSNLSVFPNSADEVVYIRGIEASHVNIYNILGSKVYSSEDGTLDKINVSSLERGMYLVEIELPDGKYISKKISIR